MGHGLLGGYRPRLRLCRLGRAAGHQMVHRHRLPPRRRSLRRVPHRRRRRGPRLAAGALVTALHSAKRHRIGYKGATESLRRALNRALCLRRSVLRNYLIAAAALACAAPAFAQPYPYPEAGEEVARELPSRSEEHTSELQSLMRISYAVFCLKKKKVNANRI